MASTRDVIAPPIFAEDASTTIPPTPIAGQSYRDPVAGPASSPDGWPYAQLVNSAEFNQLMFQWSSLLSIMDLKGLLGWSSLKDYTEDAITFGSDGTLYKWIQPSGPNNGGPQDPVSSPMYWQTLASALSTESLPSGYLSGYVLSNNGASPNTTIDVSAGSARSLDDAIDIKIDVTFRGILQASGPWASGDNQNKLLVGARANNTWYHVFVIGSSSGSPDDIACHPSTNPTADLPAGYDHYRRVGSVRTDGSGNIRQFVMVISLSGRRRVSWATPIMDVNQVTLGTTAALYAVSAPSGVTVEAKLNTFNYVNNSVVYYSDPATADLAPANSSGFAGFTCGYGAVTDAIQDALGAQISVITNTSSQIRARANVSGTSVSILNLGWEE